MSSHGTYKTGSPGANRIIRHSRKHMQREAELFEPRIIDRLVEVGLYPKRRFNGAYVMAPWPEGG